MRSAEKVKKEKKEKKEEEEKKRIRKELDDYAEVIQTLDSYRATRTLDPRRVERLVARSGSEDLKRCYHSIEGDLKRMAYYPAKVQELRGMYRRMTLAKFLALIGSVLIVIVMFATLEKPTAVSGIVANPLLVIVAIFLPVIAFNLSVITEFSLRKKLAKTYQGRFSAERSRIGAVVQSLISTLNQKVSECGEDPKKYKLSLFYDDYKV